MTQRLILLPSKNYNEIHLLQFPDDFSPRDALRHATALIAGIQEENPDSTWDDIAPVLEEHGFSAVEFVLGPELNRSR